MATLKSAGCPECDGTGFRLHDTDGVSQAAACECQTRARTERLMEAARIPTHFREKELNNFDYATEDLKRARGLAFDFIRSWPEVKAGLMFLGPPGVGKTHLAVGILKMLIAEKGAQGLYYDFRDLLKTIRGTYDPEAAASEMSVLQPVVRAQVLVLDDLGSGRASGWVQDTLFYILTSRYNEGRLLIVTSNLVDEALGPMQKRETLEGAIGSAQRSRLAEMCILVPINDAPDYRRTAMTRAKPSPF